MPLCLNKDKEKGQILLVVVLAAVISLTVGLSAVSRTITNTRVSTEEANSQKALSAAEAGVEKQLSKSKATIVTGKSIDNLSNGSDFNASAKDLSGTDILINNGVPLKQDEGADVWFSDYSTFDNAKTINNLTFYWPKSADGDCTKDAAIEIAIIRAGAVGSKKTNPNMDRYAADGCGGRKNNNGFDAAVVTGDFYKYTIPGSIQEGYIAKVIPLYANSVVRVTSNPPGLPTQGYVVKSTGKAGNTVRQVEVFQGFPSIPVEIFPYNLFLP